MRNTAEDRIAGNIDRQRDKAQVSARTLQVRELAKATINCFVMEQPANDRPEAIRAAVHHLRDLYGRTTDEQTAVALFGSLAWSAELQVARSVARGRAEQELSRLMAANDIEGQPVRVGDALASALRKLSDPRLNSVADDLERRK